MQHLLYGVIFYASCVFFVPVCVWNKNKDTRGQEKTGGKNNNKTIQHVHTLIDSLPIATFPRCNNPAPYSTFHVFTDWSDWQFLSTQHERMHPCAHFDWQLTDCNIPCTLYTSVFHVIWGIYLQYSMHTLIGRFYTIHIIGLPTLPERKKRDKELQSTFCLDTL